MESGSWKKRRIPRSDSLMIVEVSKEGVCLGFVIVSSDVMQPPFFDKSGYSVKVCNVHQHTCRQHVRKAVSYAKAMRNEISF